MASVNVRELDPAFQSAASFKPGLAIWRIEDFKVVPVPPAEVGNFHTGDSYIVLKTTALRTGALSYAIHFWLGKESSVDERGAAAIKSVELDGGLGGRAPQHREVQGHESDLFLSYFRPCLIALPGGVKSGFKPHAAAQAPPRLFQLKGRRFVRVRQLPVARASLTHSDVFILDTPTQLFQFNGAGASMAERGKALEVMQAIKDKDHPGPCQVAIIEDGQSDGDDSAQFWSLVGGFAPIAKRSSGEDDAEEPLTRPSLAWASPSGLQEVGMGGVALERALLESHRCFLLDCGAEVYVWVGRVAPLEDRKEAAQAAERLLLQQNRPPSVRVTRVAERYETPAFKALFGDWPTSSQGGREGEGKVKGLVKQVQVQGGGGTTMGAADAQPLPAPPALADSGGNLEVWRVSGGDKEVLPSSAIGRFYSGEAYLVRYTCERSTSLLFSWAGRGCGQEVRAAAAHRCKLMCEDLRGPYVAGRVVEGEEPEQFLALFRGALLILRGGAGDHPPLALFLCLGGRATQVDPTPTSLCSSDCFILQTPSAVFTWVGVHSSDASRSAAQQAAELLKPGLPPRQQVEGKEVAAFWAALGGKQEYAAYRSVSGGRVEPRLYACSPLKVEEVPNFAQGDLLSEDVMLLDAGAEVWVWVGGAAEESEKQAAFATADRYLKRTGGSEDTAVLKVAEGAEPPAFTQHFNWDSAKATSSVDPYERRLATLQGRPAEVAQMRRLSLQHNSGGPPLLTPTPPSPGEAVPGAVSVLHPYARLRLSATNPAPQIESAKRETYMSDAEFEEVMQMKRVVFYALPKWKQDNKKKTLDLF